MCSQNRGLNQTGKAMNDIIPRWLDQNKLQFSIYCNVLEVTEHIGYKASEVDQYFYLWQWSSAHLQFVFSSLPAYQIQ